MIKQKSAAPAIRFSVPAEWALPVEPATLSENEPLFWKASLDCNIVELRQYAALLSTDERERANRFKRREDRNRFTAARGILRQILAHHLGKNPQEISFQYSAKGKPQLDPATTGRPIKFNLSHSDQTALYALSLETEIGVDLERIDEQVRCLDLAARFFHADELETLSSLSGPALLSAFFSIWTRKEAYLKADGQGLSAAINSVSLVVPPQGNEQIIEKSISAGSFLAFRRFLPSLVPPP